MTRAGLVASGCAAAFALLALLVLARATEPLDLGLLARIRLVPGDHEAVAMARALTVLGEAWARVLIAVAAGALLVLAARRREAVVLLFAYGVGQLLEDLLKALVARPRPDPAFWLTYARRGSFPSGHAAGSMLLFPLLGWIVAGPRGMAAGVVLALAVGCTRPLLGVHYPADVLGGWLLGGTIAAAAIRQLAPAAMPGA